MQLMPRSFRGSLRRGLGLAAAATIGLFAVGVLATPASAHKATVRGSAQCETSSGQYIVTWTVYNDHRNTASRGRVSTYPEGADVINLPREIPAHGSIQAIQRVPGNATAASLVLDRVVWQRDGYEQGRTSGAVQLDGRCGATPPDQPKPPGQPKPPTDCVAAENAEFSHTFNGPGGAATVRLDGDKPLCKGGDQPFALISYTASKLPGAPLKKFDAATGVISPAKKSIDLKVDLPPCYLKVYLVAGTEIIEQITPSAQYGDRILGSVGKPGNGSKGPLGLFEGGTAECGTKPSVSFENTCENVKVTLINDGTLPAVFVGASKVGDAAYTPFAKPVTVDAGKRATLGVDGREGLSVKVTSGTFSQEHSWTAPESCTTPSPSTEPPTPTPGAGGGLPVTGTSLGTLIGAALLVTGAGVGLVVLARRRRRTV